MRSKYETHVMPYLDRIPKWRRDGLTEEQVAKRLGIAYSTLSLYKTKYSEILEALKKGKEELVEELEDSLYKRAMGFEYEETEITATGDGKRVKKVKKYIPPDVGALCFALKNLMPDKWRDKQEIAHSGDMTVEIELIDDGED